MKSSIRNHIILLVRYYHYYKSKHNTVANTLDPHDIYDYYKLVLPPIEWVRYCSEKKKII